MLRLLRMTLENLPVNNSRNQSFQRRPKNPG